RIAQRLALKEETLWARLKELREAARARQQKKGPVHEEAPAGNDSQGGSGPAAPEERELLEVLLAEPALVPLAAAEGPAERVQHPGLRRLIEGLYALQGEGQLPSLELLQERLNHPRLVAKALELQEVGLMNADRVAWLRQILAEFRRKHQVKPHQQELKHQLHAANDHATALELLRRRQVPNL